MAKDDPSVGTGVNNPGALNDFYDDIDGMTGAQAAREMAGRVISNIIQDAPQRDFYIPGIEQSENVIDARENPLESRLDALQQGFRGQHRRTPLPRETAEPIVANPPDPQLDDPIGRMIDSISPQRVTGDYSAFLQDQDTVTNPPTLGGSRQPTGARQGQPFGQADVVPAIVNVALSPYHAFLRAWESISAGGEASVSDVLQVAVPAALPGARLPVQRRTGEPDTIMGGSPNAVMGSRDIRLENFPSFREQEILDNARVGGRGPVFADNMTHDEFMRAARESREALIDDTNRLTGMSEDEIRYERAVRQQQQEQQALREDLIEATPDEAATILRRARTTGVLDEAPSGNVRLPSGDAANQTDLRIIGDTLAEAGVDMNAVRLRQGRATGGEESTYLVFPGATRPVKIRISNHPGRTSRYEIDAYNLSPDELRAAIQRELDPATATPNPATRTKNEPVEPDTTKGRPQLTADGMARSSQFRRDLPEDVPMPSRRLGSREDRMAEPRIHEVIVAGARAGMNNHEIRQAIKANLGEEVTEGQIHTHIKKILKELRE